MKSVKTTIFHALKDLGFKKSKGMFYIKINDVIGVIDISRPSGSYYVEFALIPLYFPCSGVVYLTYGNRLTDAFIDLYALSEYAADEEKQEWCERVVKHVKKDVLPFIKKHSAASSLNRLKVNYLNPFSLVTCPPEFLLELRMYSSLYMKKYRRSLFWGNIYIFFTKRDRLITENVREARVSEGKKIKLAIQEKRYDEIEEMFKRNIQENIDYFS